jgi:hypothetical protein
LRTWMMVLRHAMRAKHTLSLCTSFMVKAVIGLLGTIRQGLHGNMVGLSMPPQPNLGVAFLRHPFFSTFTSSNSTVQRSYKSLIGVGDK